MILLSLAAAILWTATGTADWLPLGNVSRHWDLVELAALLWLTVPAAWLLPRFVLRDRPRGRENGTKMMIVAAAVSGAALASDQTLWVIAGTVAAPILHAVLRASRKLFTSLLIGCGLLMLPWLLRETAVPQYSGEAVAVISALAGLYLLKRADWLAVLAAVAFFRSANRRRRRNGAIRFLRAAAPGMIVGIGVTALLVHLGVAKVLAIVLVGVVLGLIVFLVLSRLGAFPFISAVRRIGRRYNRAWARDATPDQAARWLAKHRLDCLDTARTTTNVGEVPRLYRIAFSLLSAKTGPVRRAQSKFSELFDGNDPPFFRSFLKVEVDAPRKRVRITCHGVTGRQRHEEDPPVEDWVELSFAGALVDEWPGRAPDTGA